MDPSALGRARGFTVIELMTVVAVMAILLAVAAPGMQGLLAAQRMRSAAFDMVSDLTLARSEAIKRGENVVVAPSASGWPGGWQVRVASTSQVLRQKDALGAGVQLSTAPSTTVTFDLNGRVSTPSAVARFGLSDGARRQRCISLDPSGRPKNSSTGCPS